MVVRAEDKSDKQKELKERLSKQGLDKETAQRALKLWESQSATDADSLKKLLRKRSLAIAGRISIQVALDIVAAVGAYNLSAVLSAQEGLPLNWLWAGLTSFLGSYFAVGVLFDFFSIGALAISSLQFQTDSAAFIGAVKELAGEGTGINVVDKAAQARNTLKVLQALNNISQLLRDEAAKGVQSSTLSDLSTYLLLQQARDQYGWDYDKEGMSYEDAGVIAKLFSRFDRNDDGKLDLSEIKALARDLEQELSDDDVKEAFKVLDVDNSRAIEFPEFVKLYQDKIQKPDKVLTP